MTSATEVLRRLLDERGVKYTQTVVTEGVLFTVATSNEHYFILVRDSDAGIEMWSQYLTPEQAIAATLGMGACRVIQTGGSLWMCSECGCEWRDKGSDGEPFMAVCGGAETPNFCPNCGRRIEQ